MAIANAAQWSFEKGVFFDFVTFTVSERATFLAHLWFLLYNDILHKEAMPHVGVPRGSPFPDLTQNTGTVPETYLQLVCLASYKAHASKVAKTICHGSQQLILLRFWQIIVQGVRKKTTL